MAELLTDRLAENKQGINMLLAVPALGSLRPAMAVGHFIVAEDPCEDDLVISYLFGHWLLLH